MQHQAGGDAGGVDRAASSALALLGLGLLKQCRWVVLTASVVGDAENSHGFAEHSAVGPELAARDR